MKITISILLILLLLNNANGNNEVNLKSSNFENHSFKIDSIDPNNLNYSIHAKIDTLYLKNINPTRKVLYRVKQKDLKPHDTLNLNFNNTMNAKIDTLYFKNLNSEKKEKDNILIQLLPVIGVILGGLLAFLGQRLLKNEDKRVNSHNLKESKRIQNLESVFASMNNLSLLDRNSADLILQEVQLLEKYVNDNNLYIDKPFEKIVQDLCDYYKDVSSDFRLKDYTKEIEFCNHFKRLFNK